LSIKRWTRCWPISLGNPQNVHDLVALLIATTSPDVIVTVFTAALTGLIGLFVRTPAS
jgi:hypothetical protein